MEETPYLIKMKEISDSDVEKVPFTAYDIIFKKYNYITTPYYANGSL